MAYVPRPAVLRLDLEGVTVYRLDLQTQTARDLVRALRDLERVHDLRADEVAVALAHFVRQELDACR